MLCLSMIDQQTVITATTTMKVTVLAGTTTTTRTINQIVYFVVKLHHLFKLTLIIGLDWRGGAQGKLLEKFYSGV